MEEDLTEISGVEDVDLVVQSALDLVLIQGQHILRGFRTNSRNERRLLLA